MKHNLEIVPGADRAMTPEQLLFNARIEKINVWKVKLAKVRDKIDAIKKKRNEAIGPLQKKVNEKEFEVIKKLDAGLNKFKLTKKQKKDFVKVIFDLICTLKTDYHDDELNKLFQQYKDIMDKNLVESQKGMSQEEIDQDMAEASDMTKEFIKEMVYNQTGLELDDEDLEDIDINDPESIQTVLGRLMNKIYEQESTQQNKKSTHKKTKIQKEKNNDLNKTGRQIYTELIKLLHPDRSKDEEERTWKTEAIKEVTEAYEKNDFYALLQLQIKYIEKAAGDIKELTGKRLDHYNGLLLQQMKDLQQQYEFLTKHGPEAVLYKELAKSKKRFNEYIRDEKYELQEKIEDLESDLNHLNNKNDLVSFVDYYIDPPLFDDSILEMLFGE